MELSYIKNMPTGGFSFENSARNTTLMATGSVTPYKCTKTGTTIVGCVFKDGVCLGTDTRATAGPIVGDKNC